MRRFVHLVGDLLSLREWQGFLVGLEVWGGCHLGMAVSWEGISVGWELIYSFVEPGPLQTVSAISGVVTLKAPLNARGRPEVGVNGMGRRF